MWIIIRSKAEERQTVRAGDVKDSYFSWRQMNSNSDDEK